MKVEKKIIKSKWSIVSMVFIFLIILIVHAEVYQKNYFLGSLLWWVFVGIFLISLPLLLKNKTTKFFKHNKLKVIISISFVCFLDTLTTYFFIKKDVLNEANVLQRILVYAFGIYFGLFFMLILSIILLIFIISKTKERLAKQFWIVAIIVKLMVSFINVS